MKTMKLISIFVLLLLATNFAQENPDTSSVIDEQDSLAAGTDSNFVFAEDSVGVYVIESYVREEEKNEIVIYFFTTSPAKASVVFEGKQRFVVSDTLGESFRFTTDVSNVKASSQLLKVIIYVEDALGNKSSSEEFEIKLPFEPQIEGTWLGYLTDCTLGGLAFLVPSVGTSLFKNENRFSFFKEIPVVVFQSEISELPWMAFSLEYAHTPDIDFRNRFFAGVKFPFDVPIIKYAAPGISYTTNFLGVNGISPEISLGFFEIFRVINFNLKARYNYFPSAEGLNHFDINIGLTSYFLTFSF
ncbi:MAG: hypothetical protein J0L60_01725 [Ignavibacteria bacterium]|nr:hypothetical protein [Ignavibacteria bacterium]